MIMIMIMAIAKRSPFVLGTLAAAAIAAPARTGEPGLHNRASATAAETSSATCVAGAPASTASAYQVDYAAVAGPPDTTGSYDIGEGFRAAHHVGSVTVSPRRVTGQQSRPPPPVISLTLGSRGGFLNPWTVLIVAVENPLEPVLQPRWRC